MIVVKLSGGLGNQMLQYSFALLLRHLGKQVELDISPYQYINEHNGPEILSLFKIEMSPQLRRSFDSFQQRERRLERYVEIAKKYKLLPIFSPWKMRHIFRFYHERYDYQELDLNENTPTIEDLRGIDNCIVSGCPNPYYLKEVEDDIRMAFSFPSLPENYRPLVSQMLAHESVAIHVRRGDYLNYRGLSLPDTYYQTACEIIDRQISNAHLYIFSEDEAYIRKLFVHKTNITIMEPNMGNKSYIDMYLMSLCKHNVIANSTFSWWGAWLNNNPNKIIIKPYKWWYNRLSAPISIDDITLNY